MAMQVAIGMPTVTSSQTEPLGLKLDRVHVNPNRISAPSSPIAVAKTNHLSCWRSMPCARRNRITTLTMLSTIITKSSSEVSPVTASQTSADSIASGFGTLASSRSVKSPNWLKVAGMMVRTVTATTIQTHERQHVEPACTTQRATERHGPHCGGQCAGPHDQPVVGVVEDDAAGEREQ